MQKDKDDSGKKRQNSRDRSTLPEKARRLSPLRPVTLITEAGPKGISVRRISPKSLGWKGYGLASVPSTWTSPFFVISAACFEGSLSDEILGHWITQCCDRTGIGADRSIIVRSSGTGETIRKRGQLKSIPCPINQVVSAIHNVIAESTKILGGRVHWIVQEYMEPRQKGLLSNERRLKKEKRDWVVEFEPQKNRRRSSTESFGVRKWRDGSDTAASELRCAAEFEISLRLKRVAMWATPFTSRTLFEWVWDGKRVSIVQADAAEPPNGIDPRALVPAQLSCIEPASLQVFRRANEADYERYGKLRNAKLYKEFDYRMPDFYVVDDTTVVQAILGGRISRTLQHDLSELTKRPLIIRTDGVNIPEEKSAMLPRSDELRSCENAKDWLRNDFSPKVKKIGLRRSTLCLIAHQFIPAVAAAWARAVPGERMVRIESLWGIPEGLYWHAHDTFEVDTQAVDIRPVYSVPPLNYKVRERIRYKGTFFAANDDGKWEPHQTMQPYDWNKSVSKKNWLFEMAHTTRLVAEREQYPVAVMWFIDIRLEGSKHEVLPWFHSRSELGSPKAAPRQKYKFADDFIINKVDDWRQLQKDLQSGKRLERVVVDPTEPELIRNPPFAKELAELSARHKFVVELSGGILSHVYHILQSCRAQVECVDLFAPDDEVVEYNKIVRDNIPRIVEGGGERAETVALKGDALRTALLQKLVEEAFEAMDARSGAELIGEIADVQEVIIALRDMMNVSVEEIETERIEKKAAAAVSRKD